MAEVESAWHRFPGYRIDLEPCHATGRALRGDLVLAESEACLVVRESDHEAQLYFPIGDVRWEHFSETDHHTICPFKGEADYWSLVAAGETLENVAWTYRRPFDEVAGLEGHVAFYADRLRVELVEAWSAEPGERVTYRFPTWGDARDLARLIDVEPQGPGHFVSPPYPDPPLGTFLPIPEERKPRRVVEAGHLLGQAIVAASKVVPDQRVVSASMIFSRAASFDAPIDVGVEVLRGGRSFSTVEARVAQGDTLRAVGILLMDAGAGDSIRGSAAMPDVPGPARCAPLDLGVTGRELRIVDGAYDPDPARVGPPEIFAWIRFREPPAAPSLHAALLAQSTGHWTIAAAMRPHEGVGQAMAHVTLSTGIMAIDIAFHDEVDVGEWLLYANPAVYSGRGQAQGQGRVFAADGRLVASYSVHAMIREFVTDPAGLGGPSSAM
ncbi:MAG: acyl-CoA thioesterase [Deltaproteobacteria bacterium]|nr:acyl-CoA thioesterase [Deltaproteobacteria bacterium]